MLEENYTQPPIPGQQLTKEQAGYVAHGPFGCLHCSWYQQPLKGEIGSCEPVGQAVCRYGCCDYWNDPDAPKSVGKQRAEYVYVAYTNYECRQCAFFDKLLERCWPVEGHIDPVASCNKWQPLPKA